MSLRIIRAPWRQFYFFDSSDFIPGPSALGAGAIDSSTARGSLLTAIKLAAAATDQSTALGTLTNWTTVVLEAPLDTSVNSICGPDAAWTNGTPAAGDTVYYNATNLTINTDGSFVTTANPTTAFAQWDNGGTWSDLTILVTPNIVGNAADTSTVLGALATAIRLAAAAHDVSTAVASLSAQIKLATQARDISRATGALHTSILVAASAIDRSSSSATIEGTSQQLSSNADDESRATAVLVTQIKLISAAADTSHALGALATQIRLAARVIDVESVEGVLSSGIPVVAHATDRSTGAGLLSTQIRLGAALRDASIVTGRLLTDIELVANLVSRSQSAAMLTTGARFHVAAVDVSEATAALTTLIKLVGHGTSSSESAGALSTQTRFHGAAGDSSRASADLDTLGSIEGNAEDRSTGAGGLKTGIPLGGAPADTSAGSATLFTSIDPDANPQDISQVTAALGSSGSGIFRADVLLKVSRMPAWPPLGIVPLGPAYQRAGEALIYAIDWTGWLAAYWEPDTQVAVGDTVRPWNQMGVQYRCVYQGVTDSVPPRWSSYLNTVVQDGSAQWKCVALDDTSLTATIEDEEWAVPDGLTVTNQRILGVRTIATINSAEATPFTVYLASCEVTTSDRRQRIGKFQIRMR